MISDDIVRLFISHENFIKNRIIFIDKDHRTTAKIRNEIRIKMQAVTHSFDSHLIDMQIDYHAHELFILKDIHMKVLSINIEYRIRVHQDREYDFDDEQEYSDDRFYIRRILNVHSLTQRSLRKLHQIRDELEINCYDRNYLKMFCTRSHVFFSYILFIDDFDVHRNMYRALKAFYMISVCLSYEKRRIIANVFILTLESHEVKMNDVIEGFFKFIQKLNRGVNLKINEHFEFVCVFAMILINDMSQQADNDDFLRHSTDKECRICFCIKKDRENLEFDVINMSRYH